MRLVHPFHSVKHVKKVGYLRRTICIFRENLILRTAEVNYYHSIYCLEIIVNIDTILTVSDLFKLSKKIINQVSQVPCVNVLLNIYHHAR